MLAKARILGIVTRKDLGRAKLDDDDEVFDFCFPYEH
jgi:hypothetical protein